MGELAAWTPAGPRLCGWWDAIDVFREQREAAEQLHGRVQEIAALLGQVRQHVNALALNEAYAPCSAMSKTG